MTKCAGKETAGDDFSEVWNAQVTETGCDMLGVERACMESPGKAAYLWKARVWKVCM